MESNASPDLKKNLCFADVDECQSNPCGNGSCSDGFNSYTCSCSAGFTGPNCKSCEYMYNVQVGGLPCHTYLPNIRNVAASVLVIGESVTYSLNENVCMQFLHRGSAYSCFYLRNIIIIEIPVAILIIDIQLLCVMGLKTRSASAFMSNNIERSRITKTKIQENANSDKFRVWWWLMWYKDL